MIDPRKLGKEVDDYVIRIRRHLHKYPEVSMEEAKTMQFICRELKQMDIPYEVVPDGGIIGTITGANPMGKTLLLRADLDALPMQESKMNLRKEKTVMSTVTGVAHTCGHDAHMAMLLGVGKQLAKYRAQLPGTVLLVFEQGEEIGGGIVNLMNHLVEMDIDGVWGIHVKNDLPSGKISVEAGPRMAAPLPFEVTIKGKGGHGSRPDLANSPIDCFVDFHAQLSKMRLQQLDPHGPVTFSVGALQAGSAANIIPESLTFAGTFRFLHIEQGEKIEMFFKKTLTSVCQLHQCEFEFVMEPRAKDLLVFNNEQCSQIAEQSVEKSIGKNALQSYPAWMASEPFAFYQAFFPGVFAFLGIQNEAKGTGADHHNIHFDVDEDVLQLGVAATIQYTFDFLQYDKPIKFVRQFKTVDELTF